MHDEFRAPLARQGIGEAAYLKATEQTEADLHAEFRPRAENRVKTLLVLSEDRRCRGDRRRRRGGRGRGREARRRYAGRPKTLAYFESERGRNFIRSTLRRTRDRRGPGRRLAGRPSRAPGAAAPRRRRPAESAKAPTRMPRSGRPTARAGPAPTSSTEPPRRRPDHEPRQPSQRSRRTRDARTDGHRVVEPRRARLRHLLAPAEGADHLPGRPDRRPHGEPDHRPAAVPRVRGSGAATSACTSTRPAAW